MNTDKDLRLKDTVFNQIMSVCERDMGIIFLDNPSEEMEVFVASMMEEIIVALEATFLLEA